LDLASNISAPSEFRLLNGAPPILVGAHSPMEYTGIEALKVAFENKACGKTPLCHHIQEVVKKIRPIEAQLRAAQQKVAIIIATDGLSSDGDLVQALKPLQQLPVWLVVRLCTDDDQVLDFWNNIDSQLELDMDVLDDLIGEAKEVNTANPWLTYGEPLHKLREFGIPIKELDLIDEDKLSREQVQFVCASL
jgi:hypothetical protein